jgi:hypothetical protein
MSNTGERGARVCVQLVRAGRRLIGETRRSEAFACDFCDASARARAQPT